jgi:hypothetical protein
LPRNRLTKVSFASLYTICHTQDSMCIYALDNTYYHISIYYRNT